MIRFITTCCMAMLIASSAAAQTKLIFHKSHSGSSSTFNSALSNDFFGLAGSNFGIAPTRIVENAELDSLIFVDNNMTIMVTSYFCQDVYRFQGEKTLWRPGRDTVYNHPHFNRQVEEEQIRETIGNQYNFKNKPDSVVIVDLMKQPDDYVPPADSLPAMAVEPAPSGPQKAQSRSNPQSPPDCHLQRAILSIGIGTQTAKMIRMRIKKSGSNTKSNNQ